MTAPVFVAASYDGSGGSVIPWPAGHSSGSVGILLVQSSSACTASGWTLIARINNLSAFWRRAVSSSESDASLSGGGTYGIKQIGVYDGCLGSGTPVSAVRTRFPMTSSANTLPGSDSVTQGVILVATTTGLSFSPSDPSTSVVNVFTERSNPAAQLEFWDGEVNVESTVTLGDISIVYGSPTQSFTGMSFVIQPGNVTSAFESAGVATVSNPGHKLVARAFSSSGTSVVSNPGNVNRQSEFASEGIATVLNPGAKKVASAFAAAGVASAVMEGQSLTRSSFNAAGTSTAIMVGAGNNASSFSSISSSSANMIGASTAESSFSSEGTSLALMFSPSTISSAFSSSGSSTAQMFSPNVVITTLVDGSGGVGEAAQIDHSLCDFAEITLSEGEGTYSIEHINLIPGKWVTVTLVNQGASGSLIWNNGDAPVDWSPGVAPGFPAEGETLDLEFFVRRDRALIRGRKAFA